MKTLILSMISLYSLNALAYDKIMVCDAVGTFKKKELFSIHADVYDARVESQGTTYVHDSLRGLNREQLTITSTDRFNDQFRVDLRVIHEGKEIESAVIEYGSLRSGVETYSVRKQDYPRKHYKMSLVCTKIAVPTAQ